MTLHEDTYPALQPGTSFGVISHRRWLLRGEAMGRILARVIAAAQRASDAPARSLRPQLVLKSSKQAKENANE